MDETELIIKYVGNLEKVKETVGFEAIPLLGGYAVLRILPERIATLLTYPEIVYTEIPKPLFFTLEEGKEVSCINNIQNMGRNRKLKGEGTLIGVIDSGIDYFHPAFRKEDGTTRIVTLWDQTISESDGGIGKPYLGNPEFGYVYEENQINEALERGREEGLALVPSKDISGHGTHVTGIAAGKPVGSWQGGVAPETELIIVKLGRAGESLFPQSGSLMEGVDFCIRRAIDRRQPISINLSFGKNEGAHNGRSLLENYLSSAAEIWKSSVVIGTGNEGTTGRHIGGFLEGEKTVELTIDGSESQVECQIWKNYQDQMRLYIIAPNGQTTENLLIEEGEFIRTSGISIGTANIQAFFQGPTPYNPLSLIGLTFQKEKGSLEGIWSFRFIAENITTGEFDIWLSGELTSPNTRFLNPTEERTLTIPSTSDNAISVGAYDSGTGALAFFSGRGYPRCGNPGGGVVKPELIAPGVDILSAAPGGGFAVRSGTSMATPFVTGSAALMLQWGVVLGNDRDLYGQRLKAFLIKGAGRVDDREYPNNLEGWGRLCLVKSLPI